jgi:hypothetical protein
MSLFGERHHIPIGQLSKPPRLRPLFTTTKQNPPEYRIPHFNLQLPSLTSETSPQSPAMPPKKHSTTKPPPSKSKPPSSTPPNWPPLKPLIPPSDLSLFTLVPSQILTISNFFTSKLSSTYVSFLKTLPLTTTPGKPKKGDALRFNDRFQVLDEQFANRLWEETGLRELVCETEGLSEEERKELWYVFLTLFLDLELEWWGVLMRINRGGEPIGLNPSIRIYRYTKGQFFDCHCKSNPSPFSTLFLLCRQSHVLTPLR